MIRMSVSREWFSREMGCGCKQPAGLPNTAIHMVSPAFSGRQSQNEQAVPKLISVKTVALFGSDLGLTSARLKSRGGNGEAEAEFVGRVPATWFGPEPNLI